MGLLGKPPGRLRPKWNSVNSRIFHQNFTAANYDKSTKPSIHAVRMGQTTTRSPWAIGSDVKPNMVP